KSDDWMRKTLRPCYAGLRGGLIRALCRYVSCEQVIPRYKFNQRWARAPSSSTARHFHTRSPLMESRILGTTMPVVEFVLEPNESVISEAGELSWMTSSIQLTTHTQFGGGGGLFGVLKRVAGGGSLFMTEYRAMGGPGGISFATKLPGHIVPIEVGAGHEYMIHRHGFLCATPQIQDRKS